MRLRRRALLALVTAALLGSADIPGAQRKGAEKPADAGAPGPSTTTRGSATAPERAAHVASDLRAGNVAEWKWWQDADVRRTLELSDDTVARLERLFQKRRADIQPYLELLRREGEKLDRMTRERTASEADYTAQVARVWDVYSWTQQSRVVMLYMMYRELRPDQHARLNELLKDRSRRPPALPGVKP